jgi:hypothetical protein
MPEDGKEIPIYEKGSDGYWVCKACGCELGSGMEPGPAGRDQKYAGHTNDCAYMIELWGDESTRVDSEVGDR